MVFMKRIADISIDDIKALKHNSIPESDVLDYKTDLVDDDQLVKHVSAFANSQGGLILFGIEETGRGGVPKDIPGVDTSRINKERIEQILLSNVSPRVHSREIDSSCPDSK
jgi:predicted HTH transcriptional regulator